MVPDASGVIDSLETLANKGLHQSRIKLSGWGDDDQIVIFSVGGDGNKRLTAQRMPFHDRDGQWQVSWLPAKQAEDSFAILSVSIGGCQCMKALGRSLIDGVTTRAFKHDDFTKRGEGFSGQGLDSQGRHDALSGDEFIPVCCANANAIHRRQGRCSLGYV